MGCIKDNIKAEIDLKNLVIIEVNIWIDFSISFKHKHPDARSVRFGEQQTAC